MDTGTSGHRIGLPPRQGLYDPQFEHDACGIGFVVNIKGRSPTRSSARRSPSWPNLTHRGAVRRRAEHRRRRRHPDPDAPRLPPARSLRASRASICPAPGSTASAWSSCPTMRPSAGTCERQPGGDRRRGGPAAPGLAHRPHRRLRLGRPPGPASRVVRQLFIGRDPRHWPTTWPSSGSCTSSAAWRRRTSATPGPRSPAGSLLLHHQPLLPDHHLQGDAHVGAAGAVLPGPVRPGHGDGPGPGPLPLQHQHLPQLGARPPLPLPDPQRRDQHPARQRQLDARPRGACFSLRALRRRSAQGAPDHRPRRQRLRHVRQLPGVPGPGRPLPAPRDDDDDPGAVVRTTRA